MPLAKSRLFCNFSRSLIFPEKCVLEKDTGSDDREEKLKPGTTELLFSCSFGTLSWFRESIKPQEHLFDSVMLLRFNAKDQ